MCHTLILKCVFIHQAGLDFMLQMSIFHFSCSFEPIVFHQ